MGALAYPAQDDKNRTADAGMLVCSTAAPAAGEGQGCRTCDAAIAATVRDLDHASANPSAPRAEA